MLREQRLAYVLGKIKELKIGYPGKPNAIIIEKTNEKKSNVSAMLSGSKPISDNFLIRFISAFGTESEINSLTQNGTLITDNQPDKNEIDPKDDYPPMDIMTEKYIALLEKVVERDVTVYDLKERLSKAESTLFELQTQLQKVVSGTYAGGDQEDQDKPDKTDGKLTAKKSGNEMIEGK